MTVSERIVAGWRAPFQGLNLADKRVQVQGGVIPLEVRPTVALHRAIGNVDCDGAQPQ